MNLNPKRLYRILEENRNQKLLVSAVLLVAAFVRVSALLSMKNTIYFDYLLLDEQIFHTMAQKIANGIYHSKSVYEFSPLPIYLMAFLYKIFSPDILVIRILNMILGVLTCFNIYLIGKWLCNNSVGLLAALIAALYKPFIFYSIVPLKTSLSVFLFSLLIVLFISALIRITPVKILFLGLFAGLILNVRPNSLVFIPFLPVLLLWRADNTKITVKTFSKLLILFIIGLFVAVSPFLVRNYKVAGVVAFTTSQTGQNLYYGNNPDFKEPYYRPAPFALASPFTQGIQFTIEASRRSGKKLSHDEASGFWTREIMKLAWDQPAFFAMKLIRKTLALFHRFEAGNHYHIDFISDYARFFKYPFFSFWLIMPLGIVGIFNSVTQSRKAFSLFFISLLYASSLVIFFVTTRFRLPLLVILIPFAAMGIRGIFNLIRNRSYPQVIKRFIVFLVFLILGFIPLYGTDDLSAYYNTHAIILLSKGKTVEAIDFWRKSSEMNKSFSDYANQSLAAMSYQSKLVDSAIYYLNKIPDSSYAASEKHAMLGDVFVANGRIKEAIIAYQTSLKINSGRRNVRRKLIAIYEKTDPQKANIEKKQLQYISSFYDLM